MATFWQLTSCIRRRSGKVCFAVPDRSNSPHADEFARIAYSHKSQLNSLDVDRVHRPIK